MANYARDPSVSLTIDVKLEDRAGNILESEKQLQEMEGIILRYIASKKSSKPTDWIDDNAELNAPFLKSIRNRHFNFPASKLRVGYGPRFEWDSKARNYRRKRYYFDA